MFAPNSNTDKTTRQAQDFRRHDPIKKKRPLLSAPFSVLDQDAGRQDV